MGYVWAALQKEPASFWLLNIYMFFEYVRPQMIYPQLAVLPWALVSLLLPVLALLLEGKGFRLPTFVSGLLGFFTLVVVLSSVAAWSPAASLAEMSLYVNWVILYVLTVSIVTTERRFFIFMLAFLLYSYKMSQHGTRSWIAHGFSFSRDGVVGGPGWFHNSGEFGIQMCIFLPLACGFFLALWRHWGTWKRLFVLSLPATAVIGLVASSSRGALLAGGLVLAWMVARSRYRFRAMIPAALVAVVVLMLMPEAFKARFTSAGEDDTSTSRLTYWRHGMEIWGDHPALGVGYGNWLPYYREYYDPTGELSHNIFIQAGAELGYLGLIAFLLLIGGTFLINLKTRRMLHRAPGDHAFLVQMAHGLDGALIGFLASGFFVTVLYYPYFWVNLSMSVALHVTAQNKLRAGAAVHSGAVQPRPTAWRQPSLARQAPHFRM